MHVDPNMHKRVSIIWHDQNDGNQHYWNRKICTFFRQKKCKHGNSCRFLHIGDAEMRLLEKKYVEHVLLSVHCFLSLSLRFRITSFILCAVIREQASCSKRMKNGKRIRNSVVLRNRYFMGTIIHKMDIIKVHRM